MVVDYIGAVEIVRELKAQLEEKLGTELIYAAQPFLRERTTLIREQ